MIKFLNAFFMTVNPFYATDLFLYPLKTSENLSSENIRKPEVF